MASEFGRPSRKLSDLDIALSDIGNSVYAATGKIEDLEYSGKVRGNGHHARQELALQAQIELYERWIDQDEKAKLSRTHPVRKHLATQALAEVQNSLRNFTAPLTIEQVDALNWRQHHGEFHPYTCGYDGENHTSGRRPILEATRDMWVCPDPVCNYEQPY